MKKAIWTNGKRTVKGRWSYYRPGDFFTIVLDQRDRTTEASTKTFRVYGNTPEWGNWKLVEEARLRGTAS